jgi:hypothetical protein
MHNVKLQSTWHFCVDLVASCKREQFWQWPTNVQRDRSPHCPQSTFSSVHICSSEMSKEYIRKLRPEQISCLNVEAIPDNDGCVRGAVLGPDQKQSAGSKVFAIVSLLVFVSWPYFMFFLAIASAFFLDILSHSGI